MEWMHSYVGAPHIQSGFYWNTGRESDRLVELIERLKSFGYDVVPPALYARTTAGKIAPFAQLSELPGALNSDEFAWFTAIPNPDEFALLYCRLRARSDEGFLVDVGFALDNAPQEPGGRIIEIAYTGSALNLEMMNAELAAHEQTEARNARQMMGFVRGELWSVLKPTYASTLWERALQKPQVLAGSIDIRDFDDLFIASSVCATDQLSESLKGTLDWSVAAHGEGSLITRKTELPDEENCDLFLRIMHQLFQAIS